MGATLYVHNVGGPVVLLSHLLVLVPLVLRGWPAASAGLRAVGAAFIMWLPWLPAMFVQSRRGGAYWLTNPSPRDLERLLASFASYGLPPAGVLPSWSSLRLDLPLVVLALVLAALALIGRRAFRRGMLIALGLFVTPGVLAVNASLLRPVFLDRALLPASVPFLVLVAGGVTVLWKRPALRPVAAICCVLLLSANVLSLRQYFDLGDGHQIKERWDHAAYHVRAHEAVDDVLVFQSNSSQLPFDYYYDRMPGLQIPKVGLPCSLDACYRYEGPLSIDDRGRVLDQLLHHRRVWLIKRWWGNWNFDLEAVLGHPFAERFELDHELSFVGVVVQRYVRRPDTQAQRSVFVAAGPAAEDRAAPAKESPLP